MQIRPEFKTALKDYLFLLEKKYPQKAVLKLVSDKYGLNTYERSMLFRGVVTKEDIEKRKQLESLPAGQNLFVDGFNVLRTVASYFLGRPVYIAMDGFLRDASELHGKPLKIEFREKALNLVLDVIRDKFSEVLFYLDSPVSFSGETAQMITNNLKKHGISGSAKTVHSADKELKQIETGIIATADSAIIENAKTDVIDLAKLTLEFHYHPDFVDLRKII